VAKAGHSWEVAEFLEDGVIDLGIVYEKPSAPGIETRLIYEDEVFLVASPRNRQLPKRREVTRQDLPQLPLLTVSWRGEFQAWTESILPEKYQASFSPDQLTLLIAYLLQGRGAAFVPKRTVERELASGKLRKLPTAKDLRAPSRKVFAISRKAGWQRPAVKSWMLLMKKYGFAG
jgi:LysR family transcriptional regulator, repressor for citA